MSVLEVQNLKKAYGEFMAVDGISFSVDRGEVFGFLGPNGAGKTSTINMLIGLSRSTQGTIIIDGIDCSKNIKRAQSIIGVVADESNLYDEMDGFDNLCFCGSLYGMRKSERELRARELLRDFSLENAEKKLFKAYSKGMKRRLCIAASIIHKPKILFLDEPTTGIDVESARFIRKLILELKAQGTTVFITTHYLEDAQRVCDRIAFIAGGRIVKIGTSAELLKNTENEVALIIRHSGGFSKEIEGRFNARFSDKSAEIKSENECLLRSKEGVDLSSIISFFLEHRITVYEAREIRPSLEDVFIRLTGKTTRELKDGEEI